MRTRGSVGAASRRGAVGGSGASLGEFLADDEEEDRAGDEVGEADGETERERDTCEEGEHHEASEGEHGREDEHLFAQANALGGISRRRAGGN